MAYTITKTDGTTLTTIIDGSLDNSTALTLPGANYVGYGQKLNENLVYLLENFAGNTQPSGVNLQGQLWFDKAHQTLNVFTKNGYSPVGGAFVTGTQPSAVKTGDTWFNNGTNQFYVYDGTAWSFVGPLYTKSQGVSGAIPVNIVDSLNNNHNIVQLQFGNVVMATVSADTAFAPSNLPGFPLINPGITFNNSIPSPTINTNVVGNLTGSVVGNLTGNSVTATNITGTLTGNVVGNLSGISVTATNLFGTLTGNTTSFYSTVNNFSTANAVIASGYITGLANVSATTATFTNLSVANAQIVSGNITGIATLQSTTASVVNQTVGTEVVGNFSTANAQITGGSFTNISHVNTTTLATANLSTANALINGGNITNISSLSAAVANFQNLTTSSINITGGNVAGLTSLSTTTTVSANFSAGNALITGGNIVGTPIFGANITNANLISATTSTPATNNRTNALATTAFVHNVMPTGMIIMWGGAVSAIPAGWTLCDGTNGTPDLRGQFIIGAGGAYNVGDSGGNSTLQLTTAMLPQHNHAVSLTGNTGTAGSHTHTATSTVTDPGHAHSYTTYSNASVRTTGTSATPLVPTTSTTVAAQTGLSVDTSVSAVTGHLHSITLSGNTSQTGSGSSIDMRPPYYALCYLQKVY